MLTVLELPDQSKFVFLSKELSDRDFRAMIHYDFMKGLKVTDTEVWWQLLSELPNDQPHQSPKQSHAEDYTEQIDATSGEDHR